MHYYAQMLSEILATYVTWHCLQIVYHKNVGNVRVTGKVTDFFAPFCELLKAGDLLILPYSSSVHNRFWYRLSNRLLSGVILTFLTENVNTETKVCEYCTIFLEYFIHISQ